MNKIPRLVLIVVVLSLSINIYSQVAVVDTAAIANSIQNQTANMAKYVEQVKLLEEQYNNMTKQLTQMENQYNSITGTRSLGDILNNKELRDYLPSDWKDIYDNVAKNGYAGLSDSAKSIYDKNKIFDNCQSLVQADEKKVCEARAVKSAQDQAFALEAFEKSKERLNQIESLMGEINKTLDPKAIAELQGRIAAEQSSISNEQTKLQMFKMVSESEEQIQYQRKKELIAKDAAQRGGIKAEPLSFDN